MKLTDSAVRIPTLTIVATLLIMIWGINYFMTMSRREDPDVEIIACWVVTTFPGALPEDVEQYVTKPIEDAVAEINEVDEIRSESGYSYSRLTIILDEDTPQSEVKQIWDNIRAKINTIKDALPDGASEPIVNDGIFDTCSHLIALTGDDYSPRELEALAIRIKDRLSLLPSAGTVTVNGAQPERIYVEFNPERLAQFGVPVNQLSSALQSANLLFPGGQIDNAGTSYSIDAAKGFGSLEDIENLPVFTTGAGQQVLVRDLATVSYGVESPPSSLTRVNGQPGVIVSVVMKDGKNVMTLGKEVEAELEVIRKELPADVQVSVIHDQPYEVGVTTNVFLNNLYSGLVLVFLVVFLFMGFRPSIPVGVAVPLSLIGGFAVLSIFGTELQRISIGGLIITLGMLVDNAIVVTDMAQRYVDEGMNRLEASLKAVKTLMVPVFTSTLTTVAAFGPLLMVPGMMGEFIKDIPITVCVAMMMSFIVAITVTPAICAYMLVSTKKCKQIQPLNPLMTWMENIYIPILDWTQKHKWITTAIVVAVFFGAMGIGMKLGMQFFPPADRDQIVVDMFAPDGTSVTETEWLAKQIEQIISEQTGVQNYLVTIGKGGPKFYFGRMPNGNDSGLAEVVIRTGGGADSQRLVPLLRDEIHQRVPGVRAEVKLLESGISVGAPIQIEIQGETIEGLREIGNQIKQVLASADQVTGIYESFGFDRPQLRLEADPAQLRAVGLAAGSINQVTAMLTTGYSVTQYRAPERTIPVVLRAQQEYRDNATDLNNLYMQNAYTGQPVPLSSLAHLETVDVVSKIQRQDRQRQLVIGAYISGDRLADDITNEVMPTINEIELPPGYSISIGGERERRTEAFGHILDAMGVALLLIMVILIAQFQSLRISLVVYLAIPLALIGAFLALYLSGWPIGFMAMLGMLSLIGIVIKTSIVLVDYIMELLRMGMGLDEAIREASKSRLRPIFLAAATTLGGLFPLAMAGGSMWEPMAWTIIGGLLASGVLTLVVVPLFFRLIAGKRALQLTQGHNNMLKKESGAAGEAAV